MPANYPRQLASLVWQSLREADAAVPDRKVVLQLLETLYFASLRTDEKRHCICTVNFLGSGDLCSTSAKRKSEQDCGWSMVPFAARLPFTVSTILKLADAADPNVSSIAVGSDQRGKLYIAGLVDQELRYGDHVALEAQSDPTRPGMFQVSITGIGCISVFRNYALVGALEHSNIISKPLDALSEGPVSRRLHDNLCETLRGFRTGNDRQRNDERVEQELSLRWQNAICRVLFNIQQYGHGGGLLIVPSLPNNDLNIKYSLNYDRMPRALYQLAELQVQKRHTSDAIAMHCQSDGDTVPCDIHFDAVRFGQDVDRLTRELLGCVRFVASLSRVDGFVLMDKGLRVHGFGVETTADVALTNVYIAGDESACARAQRLVPYSEYGTRHRAMMRYCSQNEQALGFVISQDGDIRAIMQHQGKLTLWENINVQLAYHPSEGKRTTAQAAPLALNASFPSPSSQVSNV